MSWFEPPVQRGPGLMERLIGGLFGWLFIVVAVSVALDVLITFLIPLLPWMGAAVLLGLSVHWYLNRHDKW